MERLIERLVALGVGLGVTLVLVVLAGLASSYWAHHIKPPPPKPQEYIINLQPSQPH